MIGELNQRITVQREVKTPDGMGGWDVTGWEDMVTLWARVSPYNGRERVEAEQVLAESPYRVKIRFREDITEAMRLVWGGKIMNIRSIYNKDEKRIWLTLECEAGAPQ